MEKLQLRVRIYSFFAFSETLFHPPLPRAAGDLRDRCYVFPTVQDHTWTGKETDWESKP